MSRKARARAAIERFRRAQARRRALRAADGDRRATEPEIAQNLATVDERHMKQFDGYLLLKPLMYQATSPMILATCVFRGMM